MGTLCTRSNSNCTGDVSAVYYFGKKYMLCMGHQMAMYGRFSTDTSYRDSLAHEAVERKKLCHLE